MVPEIVEVYEAWRPPTTLVERTEKLLAVVPPAYLAGLQTIVLTESGALERQLRKVMGRGRRYRVANPAALGVYHPAGRNQPAWIELRLDNMLRGGPAFLVRVPLLCDMILSDTLYHEIGHHIQAAIQPDPKPPENIAALWRKRLEKEYYQQAHAYLRWLAPLRPLSLLILSIINRSQNREYTVGVDGKQ